MVYEEVVAVVIIFPFCFHTNDGAGLTSALMATEKVTDCPTFFVVLKGWVTMLGATITFTTVIFIFAVSLQWPSVTWTLKLSAPDQFVAGVKITEGNVPVTVPLKAEGEVIRVHVSGSPSTDRAVSVQVFATFRLVETAVSLITGGTL